MAGATADRVVKAVSLSKHHYSLRGKRQALSEHSALTASTILCQALGRDYGVGGGMAMAGQFTWLGCDERQNPYKDLYFLIESVQNSADYDVE